MYNWHMETLEIISKETAIVFFDYIDHFVEEKDEP